jgi:hypothetical protein
MLAGKDQQKPLVLKGVFYRGLTFNRAIQNNYTHRFPGRLSIGFTPSEQAKRPECFHRGDAESPEIQGSHICYWLSF